MKVSAFLLAMILCLLFATVGTYRVFQPLTTIDGVLDDIRIEQVKRGRYPWSRVLITLRHDSMRYWTGAMSDELLKQTNPGDLVTVQYIAADSKISTDSVRALSLVINGREFKNLTRERLKEFAILVFGPIVFLIFVSIKLLRDRARAVKA